MRESGKKFHIGAFAAFAGLEERHVTAIIDALAAHDALPGKAARAPREATRISPSWQPSEDDIAYAREKKRWDDTTIEIEAETFRNYCAPTGVYDSGRPVVDQQAALEARASLYERMGRDTEAAEIRRQLAKTATVIPFKLGQQC